MIVGLGQKVFGALLAIAGAVIILTGHWATTDNMIADLIAGLIMLAFGATVLLMWSFQRWLPSWSVERPDASSSSGKPTDRHSLLLRV
jgi:hypothetical protein